MMFQSDTVGGCCRWLALASIATWVPSLVPAIWFFGRDGLMAVTISAVCCFAAGCLTFYVSGLFTQPVMQAYGVLGGTLIRSAFALVAALVMQFVVGLSPENYLIWLGLFYLMTLAVETALLIRRPSGSKRG